jgi:hypothetical protein
MELYLHSLTCLYGIVLKLLSRGTSLRFYLHLTEINESYASGGRECHSKLPGNMVLPSVEVTIFV